MTDREDHMDEAVHDVLAAAALLEIVEYHMERHANACRGLEGADPNIRRYALTHNEALALDEAMNNVIIAANKLRKTYESPDDVSRSEVARG